MKIEITSLLRENIKNLQPYSSARSEFKGREQGIFLDANENPFNEYSFNRYPDPLQEKLKQRIGEIKNVERKNIFIGNGSDEAIDLLIRAFCEPAKENIIVCPPTYGMYEVCAAINNVAVLKINLTPENFQLEVKSILENANEKSKMIFLCCPNNPTGNGVKWKDIKNLLDDFKGIVVVDEAYIDFASYRSLTAEIGNYPNLVVLQTLSKAWGLAGLRIGMAFANENIIDVLNKIKPPYNVNEASQRLAFEFLAKEDVYKEKVEVIKKQRELIREQLQAFSFVEKVYYSEANFILVKVESARKLYDFLIGENIVIRNRSSLTLCEDCVRITVGTPVENQTLINALKKYK